MKLVTTIDEMLHISDSERAAGKLTRLVPTMGALHRGHAALITRALEDKLDLPSSGRMGRTGGGKEVCVIVSIFVNPLQFNNPDDFSRYPSTFQDDLDICEKLNVDCVFAPHLKEMYPDYGSEQCMVCPTDQLANTLEGQSRPGHFKGMLTVVCKLFNITRPHQAYFGEKDYQQLLLVTKMSRDLSMGVKIVPVETIRDSDSLPLSSRNVRLSDRERQIAPVMYKILTDAKQAIENRPKKPNIYTGDELKGLYSTIAASMVSSLSFNLDTDRADSFEVDYLDLRCSIDLNKLRYDQKMGCFDCNNNCVTRQVTSGGSVAFKTRLLTSVIVGDVRLLDNIEVLLNS